MSNDNNNAHRGPKRWRRGLIAASLLTVGLAGGAFAQAASGGPHWGPGGRGGEAMMQRGADRLLSSVDATPDQRRRIGAIMAAAKADLQPVRASFGDARAQFAAVIDADRIDRGAAERLRAERIAAADAGSKRMLAAALDAAEVLTPEQRAKLKARFDARGRRS